MKDYLNKALVINLSYNWHKASLVAHDKESACNMGVEGEAGSILGLRRSPGGGHGNPLQCSYLENPMDRGAWRAAESDLTEAT